MLSASDIGACHERQRCFIAAVDATSDTASRRLEAWGAAQSGPGQPSPTGRARPANGGRRSLILLPTPKATDGTKGGPGMRGSSGDLMLPSAVQARHFDRYTEAVRRHEQAVAQVAPAPNQISRIGSEQLSARFVEWMMMLPEGHVTDVPNLVDSPRKSERNAMLSLLGDGVVPAQGAAGFSFLLAHLAQRFAAGVAA